MEVAVIIISILVFLGCSAYVFLMVYYPEWVGITGKSARQTIDEHREGSTVDDSDIFAGQRKPPPES